MIRVASTIRSWSRLLMLFFVAAALVATDLPSRFAGFGYASVYADDDDGGDDDGGGGASSSGGSGGGRRYRAAPNRDNLFRLFKRQFRQERPRKARRGQPRTVAAVPLYVPNQIIAAGLTNAQIETLVAGGYGVDERQTLTAGPAELVKLRLPRGRTMDAARSEIRTLAPASSVDFNHLYEPEQDIACGGKPCVAPSLVGWPARLQSAAACSGDGMTIGLIDTGINPEHATFAASRLEIIRLHGEDVAPSGRQHGTAVASLLVGTGPSGTPGLVPGAKLIAIDAFQRQRGNDRSEAYDLVRAIDLLAARNVDVMNLSLSGPDNIVLAKAVSQATAKGITLVAAAGNEGPQAKPVFPAGYPEVLAVTAIDRQKKVYRRANQGDYVDLAAPGVGVWTAASIDGTRPKTGTSFAAPFVTAAAILVKASGRPAGDIQSALSQNAEDLGTPGKDAVFGWGLLNVSGICGAKG